MHPRVVGVKTSVNSYAQMKTVHIQEHDIGIIEPNQTRQRYNLCTVPSTNHWVVVISITIYVHFHTKKTYYGLQAMEHLLKIVC